VPIRIPDFALVVLVGATGSGKSSFAAREFLATEIVSSDLCRALVSDDETDQTVTSEAFSWCTPLPRSASRGGGSP
jgi:protein phosphatase